MDVGLWLGLLIVALLACIVGAAEAPGSAVVVDNAGAGFRVLRGEWNPSTRNEGYVGSGYLWNAKRTEIQGQPDAVEFRPDLPEAGPYKVYAHWVWGKGDRARNAPYIIHYAGGSQVRRVDMSNQALAAKWHLLGVFPFEKGDGGCVELTDDADNSVVADAVKFVPVGSDAWAELNTIAQGGEGTTHQHAHHLAAVAGPGADVVNGSGGLGSQAGCFGDAVRPFRLALAQRSSHQRVFRLRSADDGGGHAAQCDGRVGDGGFADLPICRLVKGKHNGGVD